MKFFFISLFFDLSHTIMKAKKFLFMQSPHTFYSQPTTEEAPPTCQTLISWEKYPAS